VEDRIRDIAERVARSYHLEVFDVQNRRESRGWVVRIYLDRPLTPSAGSGSAVIPGEPSMNSGRPEHAEGRPASGEAVLSPGGGESDAGVSIEDCERVSRDVSAILDVEDVMDHAYTLEVSSPGLDRPLRRAADYRRFSGRLAKIVVSDPVDNQKHLAGRLWGLEGETVLLEGHGGRIHRIPMSSITRARLDVEF
jgi:ribosome maturation factor RimP